jgi:hypothetical protein
MWQRLLNIWGLGRGWPPGCTHMGSNMIHRLTVQKTVAHHHDRFWTSIFFDDSRWLIWNLDVGPVSLEALYNFLSTHIKNVQNRLYMRSRHRFWCMLLLDSEVGLNLNCFGSFNLVTWTELASDVFLTWTPLLDSSFSIPCTNHGRMHEYCVPHHFATGSTDLNEF